MWFKKMGMHLFMMCCSLNYFLFPIHIRNENFPYHLDGPSLDLDVQVVGCAWEWWIWNWKQWGEGGASSLPEMCLRCWYRNNLTHVFLTHFNECTASVKLLNEMNHLKVNFRFPVKALSSKNGWEDWRLSSAPLLPPSIHTRTSHTLHEWSKGANGGRPLCQWHFE